VWVTGADLDRIAAHLGADREDLTATSVRRVGRRRSLRERPNGDCVFYANGCTIYPVRPRQCRTFPFWPEDLTSRRRWERLARECPGIGRGRLWSRREVDLLAGRGRGRRRPIDPRLARAFRRLLALYRAVDAALAPWADTCSACGRCCDFATHEQVLYVTELEWALLISRCGPPDRSAPPHRCPYQAGSLCSAREVRPLGCRTFFCDAEAAGHGRDCFEAFLRRMAPVREEAGLDISYQPLLALVSAAEKKASLLP
jgi:Fe-S-cluster containining protein